MKKKIVIIFVLMLLITTTMSTLGIPSTLEKKGELVNQYITKPYDYEITEEIDQSQEICDDCKYIQNYAWQQFISQGNKKLLTIDLSIAQWFSGSPDLKITIEKPIGTILSFATIPVTSVPENVCDWVSINLQPDITLEKGQIYYLVFTYEPGGEYGWCGTSTDPYTSGISSVGPNWDFCFRTIVNKPRSIESTNIFKHFPILYQFLQKVIDNIQNLV